MGHLLSIDDDMDEGSLDGEAELEAFAACFNACVVAALRQGKNTACLVTPGPDLTFYNRRLRIPSLNLFLSRHFAASPDALRLPMVDHSYTYHSFPSFCQASFSYARLDLPAGRQTKTALTCSAYQEEPPEKLHRCVYRQAAHHIYLTQ
jgi:hypothetical protein